MSHENMIQTDSEYESDVSSLADSSTNDKDQSKLQYEHLVKRLDSLTQENRVLQMELQTYKLRLKASQQEIKELKHTSMKIQAKAEEEEEFISNRLFQKIKELKKEKEILANNFEREEEFLTNDLSRKLQQIRDEKHSLEKSLEQEQATQINQLMKRIQRLESETINKQNTLEQLKREKIELENTLEKEQESLVNRLCKRMEKLEMDKKLLLTKLQQSPHYNTNSDPSSSSDFSSNERLTDPSFSLVQSNYVDNRSAFSNLNYANQLKCEIEKLRSELNIQKDVYQKKISKLILEEQNAKYENLRLQRKLQIELDRRQQLYKQLSESESSLEIDEERALNLIFKSNSNRPSLRTTSSSSSSSHFHLVRSRTASSPAFSFHQNIEHLQRTPLPSNNIDNQHSIE